MAIIQNDKKLRAFIESKPPVVSAALDAAVQYLAAKELLNAALEAVNAAKAHADKLRKEARG